MRLARCLAVLLTLLPASLGAQEPSERPPVRLPPSTTVAEARRAATPHNYWRGVDTETGCPRGLTSDECAFVSRAVGTLLEHQDPYCRAIGERVSERIARGRVIVPASDGPVRGPRVERGDIVLPANWVTRPTLVLLLAAQGSRDGMDAGVRCGGDAG